MSYQTSYESGGDRPFKPDKDRGFWSSSSDFFYACVCNAFRMDVALGVAAVPFLKEGGIYMFIAMILNIALFAYPIVFMQSFLGQFSSSGFISAFRVSPLFKGIGYVSLVLNLGSLSFYAIFAAVPILFLLHSLHPVLPWSCEAWALRNHTIDESHCSEFSITNETDENIYQLVQIPSVEYFTEQFHLPFSFSMYGCVVVVWGAVAIALCNTTENIGKMLRYCSLTLFGLLSIVLLRMAFLPGAMEGLAESWNSHVEADFEFYTCVFMATMLTMATFGPAWGSILSMASYNSFKTDINKYSWLICFSQFGVLVMIGLLCLFTESHLTYNKPNMIVPTYTLEWKSFLSIPSSLATMELPHLWTWMFLLILIIGSFNLMISQMFSILTALFDEFEALRLYKVEVTFTISGVLALASGYFCTETGLRYSEGLAEVTISTQALINFLLLIIVVWVYGRERFQRDVEFMTSRVLQTWKVYTVRFVTPLFLCVYLLIGLFFLIGNKFFTNEIRCEAVLTVLSWQAIPVYCLWKLLQTNGSLVKRFKRCVKPTDWYPVELADRQRYEETIDNPETFQPLTDIVL